MTKELGRPAPGRVLAICLWALLPGVSALAAVEEEPATGWGGSADVSVVATSGNAEAESIALGADLARRWERSEFRIHLAGLRAESTTTTRFGIGTPDDFVEVKESTTELTAENYQVSGRYERFISERFFWQAGAGWNRNTFAGIANRYVASAGAGHHWFDGDRGHFTTAYGLSYTRQENVVGGSDEGFLGVRLDYDYERLLTSTTTFGSSLVADASLEETSDYRLNATNWIRVSINERLALKVSLQALYENDPALIELELFDETGAPTGETALAQLSSLDLLWNVALVVGF